MFLDGRKLRPYIPVAEARGFTGAVDKCSKRGVDKFIDLIGPPVVFLVVFIGIFLVLFYIVFVFQSDSTSKDSSRAAYVLEKYATSYESLRSTDKFLTSQIDVIDVNDGKDVALSFYNDDHDKISTVYFHVNPDLSYRHIKNIKKASKKSILFLPIFPVPYSSVR